MDDDSVSVPGSITPEIFKEWRSRRYGNANPQRLNNPLWEWLIESRLSAYQANRALHGPSSLDVGPMWCFERFGQSVTRLADDVTILIGGEHEDAYDSNFLIYNDLVLVTKHRGPDIYGYPRTIFPPTDFHTASALDDRIVLIGNLGYPEDRHIGETQVLLVGRSSWSVSRVDCRGCCPGWIHSHHAELQPDTASVILTGGKIFRGEDLSLVENIDDWRLHFDEWRWERLTDRGWPRFEVYRKDGKPNHLWQLQTALWDTKYDIPGRESRELNLKSALDGPPRLDLIPSLYRPSIPHDVLPQNEDEYQVHRILVHGVVVRYVENTDSVQVTVEGELQSELIEQVRQDLTRTLEALEQSPMVCEEII